MDGTGTQFGQPALVNPSKLLLTAAYLPNQCTQLFVSAGGEGLWSTTQLFDLNNQNVNSGQIRFSSLHLQPLIIQYSELLSQVGA